VYRMSGNNARSLEEFEKVLELQPQSPVALFNAADLSLQLRKYNEAVEYASTLVEKNPGNVRAKYVLSQAYSAQGDMGNAAMELEDIVGQQKEFQPAVLDLGLVYLAEEDFASAREQFENLLKVNEKQTAAMLGIAIAAQEQGADADAVKYCEQTDNQMAGRGKNHGRKRQNPGTHF